MRKQIDSTAWAQATFGACDLGDPRRTKRLVDIASLLAEDPSGSLSRVCRGNQAAKEGTYRFVENRAVRPDAVIDGICSSTASLVDDMELYLAIQDTTHMDPGITLKPRNKDQGSGKGYFIHSTLAVDAATLEPLGLLDQQQWIRADKKSRPGKKTRKERAAKNKESYKWTEAFESICSRVHATSNFITVCDREADIADFLKLQIERDCRFVVRASHNRKILTAEGKLLERLSGRPVLGEHIVSIGQRGPQRGHGAQQSRKSRKARDAQVEIKTAEVHIAVPQNAQKKSAASITVNAVYVNESNPPENIDGISWVLLTTEPVSTIEQALKVVQYYSARWLIEEFHKAWKSGCKMEERRLQSLENYERVMAVTAAVAVRLLQLKSFSTTDAQSCDSMLNEDEWKCLFMHTEDGGPIPNKPPSARWAYYALAKLAGWTDSKSTGRVGWQTLWLGWERLQYLLIGWKAAIRMMADREAIK